MRIWDSYITGALQMSLKIIYLFFQMEILEVSESTSGVLFTLFPTFHEP